MVLFCSTSTQGAQACITQFYLQITPCLPLSRTRKRSQDGDTTGWWRPSDCSLLLIY